MATSTESQREALRREIASARDLPSPSRVIQEIWRVLSDEGASAQALAEVLRRDPALSARVLRLANSAYFALANPASDVRGACVVLGFETVRGLAVGVAALDRLARRTGDVMDLAAFWRHSIAVATASETLARRSGTPETGTAFCAGMLHDIGRLALAALRPGACRQLFAEAPEGTLAEAETEAVGASHDEVGGWLAERWALPAPVAEAIRDHHRPPGGTDVSPWARLVHVADHVAHRAGFGLLPDFPGPEAPEAAWLERMGLTPAVLDDTAERLAADVDRLRAFTTAAREDADAGRDAA